ncbi:DUF1553 domain-containing protein [Pseudozobellia thermophila]|uniref:Uncharacterized membrane protein n=1 Tax=Pseudozobellia thermophila TaxID=192903 RepID=A0A1M6CUZ6_9FLAO|nr:DUF1553 domain-containing protein [Pseudozobellia thermophila]SHI64847.1 Uncharacterized membrane protein [Pseudozobellia thermophila]
MEDFNWIFKFLGRLHPLLVHFPIGLLVVALFLELLTLGGKRPGLREGIHWMVFLGTVSAVLSALFGWLLRNQEDYSGTLVDNHQYLGIATALFAIITLALLRGTLKGKLPHFRIYRISLLCTVILLTLAGHLGANLTHGEDYLTSVFTDDKTAYDEGKGLELLAELKRTDTLSAAQQDRLNLEVRAILAHNCYQCHSENKQKGDLVLDSKEGVFKGGESGEVVIAGNPDRSELYRRITLAPDHDEVMPKKGKVLKKSEIALIGLWIKNGAHWSDQEVKVFPEAELALVKPVLPESDEKHPVDKLIGNYFDQQNKEWPPLVEDRVFVRRAYLDIVGLLPPKKAVDSFVKNTRPDKRSVLIDSLLADGHNYTQHWLSFWNDLLRNDYSGTGFITGGRKQITDWLYNSLLHNKGYDQMVKELIDPSPESEGFIKGIQWRGVVNASQRTEMQAAQNIGQSLLGVNVKCASCHNSFVSNLTLEQSYGFASIFADSVLELNRCDKPLGKMAEVGFLYPELGDVKAENVQERLFKLSQVMVKPENGRLYRTIVNRYWAKLMGRGIVEPLDEMDNQPWDRDLLDWLASDFIDSGHDLKHLIKRIMTSKAYQLAAANYERPDEVKEDYVFNGPLLRRLSAEQFSDAVSQVFFPVFHAVEYDPSGQKPTAQRIWHREIKFDRDVLPEPGKRYFRKSFVIPAKNILEAKALISVDHAYTLYINGEQVAQGNDWKRVGKIHVGRFLRPGKNLVAIEGVNEGVIANPAGVLFAMEIEFDDGHKIKVDSDTSWKSSAEHPNGAWTAVDFDDTAWGQVRNYGHSNWGKLVGFTFEDDRSGFARASLVKQHSFLKALGRPSRENVTTSRDQQATLLQALELTNGEFFNSVLEEAAELWIEKFGGEGQKIVDHLYWNTLGRNPSEKERNLLLSVLGDRPKKEDVQDVFWSTVILPEFQFIN